MPPTKKSDKTGDKQPKLPGMEDEKPKPTETTRTDGGGSTDESRADKEPYDPWADLGYPTRKKRR